jgi:hypothetical protein
MEMALEDKGSLYTRRVPALMIPAESKVRQGTPLWKSENNLA